MINQLLSAADERPWLWALYLLTAALPIGLLVLFCWPRKKIEEEEEDADFAMSDFLEPDEAEFKTQKDVKKENLEDIEDHKGKVISDNGVLGIGSHCSSEDDEKSQEEEHSHEDEEAGATGNPSSDDEMKEADEGAYSGDSLKKSLRKRRVRKD